MAGIYEIIAILVSILIISAVSRKIQGTIITLPMICTILGLIFSIRVFGLIEINPENEINRIIAELTLVLVLATDASRINLNGLIKDHSLPSRMLIIGLPLMMFFGTILAVMIFVNLDIWEAATLAIILAPTDAGLGQAVVSDPRVPVRIRQTLNIESGLNDGIAMPFLLLAMTLAEADFVPFMRGDWIRLTLAQIGFGILVGAIVGFLGGLFINWGKRSGWMAKEFQKVSSVVLPILAYVLANLVGGNGFIAAFVYGVFVAHTIVKDELEMLHAHVEVESQTLMLLTFLVIFGATMLPPAIANFNWPMVLYAILSLTLIRFLSVGLSLIGSRVRLVTVGFLGWFGPRGIASILYTFSILEKDLPHRALIINVVTLTVLISIFAHGISAVPLAAWYARLLEKRTPSEAAERKPVPEMPLRKREWTH